MNRTNMEKTWNKLFESFPKELKDRFPADLAAILKVVYQTGFGDCAMIISTTLQDQIPMPKE